MEEIEVYTDVVKMVGHIKLNNTRDKEEMETEMEKKKGIKDEINA